MKKVTFSLTEFLKNIKHRHVANLWISMDLEITFSEELRFAKEKNFSSCAKIQVHHP